MKSTFLVLTLLFSLIAQAQFGPQQVISDNIFGANLAIPIDLDNDGFMDVVARSFDDDKIVWFRNQNGLGDFSDELIITTNSNIRFIEFTDIDSDNDLDLLFQFNSNDNIGWLEHLDGTGTFDIEKTLIIQTGADEFDKALASDVDGDGDTDIIATYYDAGYSRIRYFLNQDGLGTYGPGILLYEYLLADIPLPKPVDIDLDGDLDLFAGYSNSLADKLVWYETIDPLNPFEVEHFIYQLPFFASDWTDIIRIQTADLTADGLMDVILFTENDDTGVGLLWLSAIDTLGNFEHESGVLSFPSGYRPFRFFDLDNDGDNDVLRYALSGNDLYWSPNSDGNGTFLNAYVFSTEVDFPSGVEAADFNGDGLLDVVSCSILDDKIAWYENTGILEVPDHKTRKFSISPNPTQNKININGNETFKKATLFNQLGQDILTFNYKNQISLESLASGIYFLRITSDSDISEVHKIIKE